MAKLRDPHVALFAFPFGTHAAPLLAVVRSLAIASPTTVFSFFNTSQSNSSLFSSSHKAADLPSNIRVHDIADGLPDGYVFTGNVLEMIELFLTAAPENFRRAIASVETEVGVKVTCMVTDALFWFVADMAEEMNASWVAFWTAAANSLSAHVYTDQIREAIGVNEAVAKEEETIGFIRGLEKMRVKDAKQLVFADFNSAFPKALYHMGLELHRATAVFINSFEELDPTLTDDLRSKFKCYLNIGPLALLFSTPQKSVHDPHGCLAWIEKQSPASVAYISFGTVMPPPPEELVAIAQGLESSKVPFIWSLKEKNLAHLPQSFFEQTREQGIVVPWAPQAELLKHEATGVFVTHGGWNSVLESVSGGVPMICRPFFGDQMMNGRAVEVVWEIGMTIINGVFTKEGFKECLHRVLVQDDGKKMQSDVKKLKEQAQEAVSSNGTSFKNFKRLQDLVVNISDAHMAQN